MSGWPPEVMWRTKCLCEILDPSRSLNGHGGPSNMQGTHRITIHSTIVAIQRDCARIEEEPARCLRSVLLARLTFEWASAWGTAA